MRGYKHEGTTTTPFDKVMLNDLERDHPKIDRAPGLGERLAALRQETNSSRLRTRAYTLRVGEDPAQSRGWTWTYSAATS